MEEQTIHISISNAAQAHFARLLEQQEEGTNIRIFVVNPGTPGQNAVSLTAHPMQLKRRIPNLNLTVSLHLSMILAYRF